MRLKGFNKATSKIKTGSNVVLKVVNVGITLYQICVPINRFKESYKYRIIYFQENVRNCKNKLEESCKPLYVISDAIDEKRKHYKRKVGIYYISGISNIVLFVKYFFCTQNRTSFKKNHISVGKYLKIPFISGSQIKTHQKRR